MSDEVYDFEKEFQAVFIPKQKPPPEPIVTGEMGATVSSYPPLGQVTQLKDGNVKMLALLDVEEKDANEPWELAAWHNSGQEGWAETILSPLKAGPTPSSLQTAQAQKTRLYFSSSLPVRTSLNFTIKFRSASDKPWRWVKDEQHIGDGTIIVNPEKSSAQSSTDFSEVVKELNPDLKIASASSQCPGTELWTIEAPVDAAEGDTSTYADFSVGIPWGGFLGWFSLVRIWTPWLAPRHGKTEFNLDKDAVMVAFLSPAGKHLVLLALSGVNDVTAVIRHSESGQPLIHIRNDGETATPGIVLAAIGNNFESALAAVMYHSRNVIQAAKKVNHELDVELQALREGVKPEWMENWYDGLGYCTWNALGQDLTDEKVFNAVDKLAENNINVTSLIIDDNWQDIDYDDDSQFQRGWKSFEAEPKAFPRGLKETVTHIRSKHPNIQHIAVWHALLGYWGGITPGSKLDQTYKTVKVEREDAKRRNLPLGGPMTLIAKEDVGKFYDDFYRFLSDCGIDGVKTDAQFMIDTIESAKHRRELTNTYLDAWMISSLRHFSIKAISCMSQTPHILFYSQLPRNRPAVLVRNSDDFFPAIPKSHPWHIWTNAHNSLLTQHLNILPDWDMFQTIHDYSGFHAAARCVSGGPIYITDTPGQHNLDLIYQMTGPTPRGKTVIFRPSVLGRALDQYVGYDDDTLLKVGCYHGRAVTGVPILGVFNISARPLTEFVPLSRFFGVVPSVNYVIRAHSSGMVSPIVKPVSQAALLPVSLDVRGYDIFSAFPLEQYDSESIGRVYTANLGLLGKMTGAAAIVTSEYEWLSDGRVFLDTRIKALGVLGVYISTLPQMTIEGDFMVTIQGQPIPPHTVSIDKADEHVLRIDVEAAWKEMGLKAGWSNEVEVKVYFTIDH
ncbi:putative Raffinose synthase Sip1 [Seiridium unicorne]|uniref:Raffinose synthase Sip1 n=1 Tax=Seiridium unicorne TaxID=138068 RepID=A0ABR2VFW5_9PEZI